MKTAPLLTPKVKKSVTPKSKLVKPNIINTISGIKKTAPKSITPLRVPRMKNKTPNRYATDETLNFSVDDRLERHDRVDSLPLDELVKQALEISLIEPERETPPRQAKTPNLRQPVSSNQTPRNK